jgi:hypothetical protein
MRLVKEQDINVTEQQFDHDCDLKISIRKMKVNAFLTKLSQIDSVVVKYEYSA